MLSRLTDDWQAAQPAHLRHLGLIRDTGTQARFTYYKYRTYDGFQQAVDNGDSKWEIVRSRDQAVTPPPPTLDQWGFPAVPQNQLLNDGRATLSECVAKANIQAEVMTSYDPVLARNGNDGAVAVAWRTKPSKIKVARTATPAKDVVSSTPSRPRGRPKKYPDTPTAATDKKEIMRQYNAEYRQKKKLEEEQAERTVQIRRMAEKTAYEETSASQKASGVVTILPESVNVTKYKPTFKPSPGRPKLVIVNELPAEILNSGGRQNTENQTPQDDEPNEGLSNSSDTVETNSPDSAKKSTRHILVLESRIKEIVVLLSDTSRHAVHINPPRSKPTRPLIRGRRLLQLIVVFKFPWLNNLDWFGAAPSQPPAITGSQVEDNNKMGAAAVEATDSEAEEGPIVQYATRNRNGKRSLTKSPASSSKRPRIEKDPVASTRATPLTQPAVQPEEDVDMADALSDVEVPDANEPVGNSNLEYNRSSAKPQQDDSWNLRSSNYKKPELPSHRTFRKKKGIALGGGSVQFKRTLLVVEIIEKCGGAFPGDGEIITVYQRFQKKTDSGNSDRDTIIKAVKSCVDTGKLKKIAYAFSNNGLAVTRNILLLPDVDIDTPVAQAIMKGVQEVYPKMFQPAEVAETPKKQTKNISRFLHQDFGVSTSGEGEVWNEIFRTKQKEMEERRAAGQGERNRQQRVRYQLAKTGRPAQDGLELSQKLVSLKRRTREQREALEQLPELQVPDWAVWTETQGRQHEDVQKEGGELTMAELLSDLGSFAPAYRPSRDDEHEEEATPGNGDDYVQKNPPIESDRPSNPRRGRTRPQLEATEFWIMEDPAARNEKRFSSARRGSGYSGSNTETDEDTEYRIPSTSTDNAVRSSQHIIDLEDLSPRRSRPNEADSTAYLDGCPQTRTNRFSGDLQSAACHRSFAPAEQESATSERIRRKMIPRSVLVADQLTFKTIGPQNYNHWYQWEDGVTLLDPDQRFHPSTGTFSTDIFVRRNVRASKWVQPTASLSFENTSSTRKRDVDDLLEIDDRDIHYHPDRPPRQYRAVRHRNGYGNGDQDDDVEDTYVEREEMRLLKKAYPGLAVGKNQDGFVNYSLGHEQKTAPVINGEYNYRPGDRIMVYGASSQILPQHVRQAPLPQPRDIRTAPGGYGYVRTPGGVQGSQQRNATQSTLPHVHAATGTLTKKPMKQNPNCIIQPDVARRLLFAVIAVRTLAGGLDTTIKWPFINTIFASHPHYDLLTFKARWQRMYNNHKDLIVRLTRDFQDTFILAYHRSEVPKFNTSEMMNYDWNALIDWAVRTIQVFPDEIVLPAHREALDHSFTVTTAVRTKNHDLKSKMEHILATNTQRAVETHNLDVFVPLAFRPRQKPSKATSDLTVARSWTRACSATASEVFDSHAADLKLRSLDDKFLAEAIRQLHEEKVISHTFKGRHKPGRNFHLSDNYHTLFTKRPLEIQHFTEAVTFKQQLDKAKATREEPLVVKYDASDGQYLVIIELIANGRIRAIPQLPAINSTIGDPWPRLSVWGFMEGHYRGRDTDKKVFMWDVGIEKTDTYTPGLPLEQNLKNVPPPMSPGVDEAGKERIPIWRDIHGNLREDQWLKLLYCVVQHAAVRAGSSIDALRAQFKGLVWDWEMELLVGWLIEVGAARWTYDLATADAGNGVIAREWWWTVLPECARLPTDEADASRGIDLGTREQRSGKDDEDIMPVEGNAA
jgi:hypothetical protein